MKKNLLYLIIPMLFAGASVNAQVVIKTWDFGLNRTIWPLTTGNDKGVSGVGTKYYETTNDQLGLYASLSTVTTINNFGAINGTLTTFADGYAPTSRFQFGGVGYTSGGTAEVPTQRYVYFTVNGACTVKVWFKTSSANSARSVLVSNGSEIIGKGTTTIATPADATTDFCIFTATVSAAQALGKKICLYTDLGANLYKIEVSAADNTVAITTPSLGTNSFSKESDVTVYSKDKKVFFSNIKSSTQVDVYDLTGAVVKSTKTDNDSSLDLTSGIYIVKLKSTEGEKSVKVIVQ